MVRCGRETSTSLRKTIKVMTSKSCPICSGLETDVLGRKNQYTILRCKCCLHWWAQGVSELGSTDLESFKQQYCNYDEETATREYSKLANGEQPGNHVHKTNLLLREILRELKWAGQFHLDVGCGSGYLLGQSKQAELSVQGVEPGPWGRKASERWSIPVENNFLRSNHFDRPFDLVTATDVIEHQADPVKFLNVLKSNTSDTGLIVISFPYTASFNARVLGTRWHMVFPPTHCQFFSRQSAAKLAKRCGLQIDARRQHNTGGFPILSRSRLFTRLYSRALDALNWGDQLLIALKRAT
jgi:2-polyprenyl-3-methyl-5-hydroxy-6-metoxy-1,4-benzoquinol methylase